METTPSLLQRYRRDRRKLLKFLISPSAGYIKELRNSTAGAISLSSIDFDTISADYVLNCIHQSKGILDVSEATRKFAEEARYPVTMDSELGDTYFLVSDPESAGSPPRRAPPPIVVNHTASSDLHPSGPHDSLIAQKIFVPSDEFKDKYAATQQKLKPVNRVLSLGLPALHTGLSDDDLRESAYEILLTCMAFYGLEIYTFADQKKDKSSGFLAGLKNKRDKKHPQSQSQSPERHEQVINTIRVQMQEWDNQMSTSERTEVLAAIRQVSLLLSVNGHFGETCYWATSYHFNITLYEKLLFGIFDILDEGNFIERLYDLGARRVLVTGTGPLGCVPGELAFRSRDGSCAAEPQLAAELYNPIQSLWR